MIGDHDHRPSRWNAGAIRRVDLQVDPHLSEQILQTKAFGRVVQPPVQISHFIDRS
jgi:hypothetical protein